MPDPDKTFGQNVHRPATREFFFGQGDFDLRLQLAIIRMLLRALLGPGEERLPGGRKISAGWRKPPVEKRMNPISPAGDTSRALWSATGSRRSGLFTLDFWTSLNEARLSLSFALPLGLSSAGNADCRRSPLLPRQQPKYALTEPLSHGEEEEFGIRNWELGDKSTYPG